MNKLLAVGVMSAAVALATQAQATTYLLTQSQAFGTGSYGSVVVSQDGVDKDGFNQLKYVVTLNSDFRFNDSGNGHVAFAFAIKGAPTFNTFAGPTGFSLDPSANGVANKPFDGFDYALDCPVTCKPSGKASNPSTLTFTVSAPGLTESMVDYATKAYNANNIFFAADVVQVAHCSSGCKTGAVGAMSASAVPEPAAWGMMTLGLFGLGFALRRRRQGAAQAVTA
jgi:hypothetical protein